MNPRQAIAILRVSTDAQDLERQRRDIAAAARVHNLKIVRTLELEGLSGTKTLTNTEVRRVLADLSRPDIAGVCISAIDRLVRPGELGDLAIFDAFQRTKKRIFTPGQEIDLTTQAGFLTSGIMGIVAGLERQMILARTLAGKEIIRQRGGNPGGAVALPRGLGYIKAAGWCYEEPDAARIKLAYDLLFERLSWRTIAERIGGGWTHEGIRRSLQNPVWKGLRRYTHGRETPLEVPLDIEPLIPPERWEAAQQIILERHQHWMKTLKPPRFLLTGLLRCACGKRMYIRSVGSEDRTRQRNYYYCASALPAYGPRCGARTVQQEAADRTVERIASTELLDAGFLKAILGQFQGGQTSRNENAAKLARERSKLEAERQELLRLTLKKVCTEDDFARESKRIEAELRSRDARLAAPLPDALDPARLVVRITRAFARFANKPFREKRSVLQAAVREIVIENLGIRSVTLNGAFLSASANSSTLSSAWRCTSWGML
jgi:site-specific DNA recombinase